MWNLWLAAGLTTRVLSWLAKNLVSYMWLVLWCEKDLSLNMWHDAGFKFNPWLDLWWQLCTSHNAFLSSLVKEKLIAFQVVNDATFIFLWFLTATTTGCPSGSHPPPAGPPRGSVYPTAGRRQWTRVASTTSSSKDMLLSEFARFFILVGKENQRINWGYAL